MEAYLPQVLQILVVIVVIVLALSLLSEPVGRDLLPVARGTK